MKALVYTGPESLEIRDVPPPAPAAGELIVQVESAGICGSDMHAYLGHDERRPAPLILGHEVAGVAVMPDGSRQRVTINPLVTCGTCRACRSGQDNLCPERQIISMPPREGGFAEWVALPERNLVAVPGHVSSDQAALAEPIACGWHAARIARAHPAGAQADARALVFGGGAIGLGAALSLKAQGIADIRIVEPNAARAAYLKEACGMEVIAPEAATSRQYDVIVDGVGIVPTRAAASLAARPGGIIVHIGLGSAEGGLDIRRMTLQEITFTGTYTYTSQDFRDCAQAMFDGRLGPLDWTERRPLSEGAAAFADIRAGRVQAPKILLKPDA
ncbi:L-threonine 3-dehydrogenase [Pseudoruegeria aquimaris]|uniref:L-threonine 3-dehydrogenase n=1 Tax=Pseudoruegeria aquimaris TaxID=393663 RepID=A0A1Y5TGB7_9RHOB|nr:alcohol dehydrogenase catalytic domain-containing protein [Pseudoruegeria aquimaris]SLN59754.1 L-threonine 3-dehydrogenase [Pseudoruegeria aquimaris]